MKLDAELARAIVELLPDPRFQTFLRGLGRYGEALTKQVIDCPEPDLPRARGMLRATMRIATSVEKATELLKKLERTNG